MGHWASAAISIGRGSGWIWSYMGPNIWDTRDPFRSRGDAARDREFGADRAPGEDDVAGGTDVGGVPDARMARDDAGEREPAGTDAGDAGEREPAGTDAGDAGAITASTATGTRDAGPDNAAGPAGADAESTGDADTARPAGAGTGTGNGGAATASTATGTRARDASPDDARGPAGADAESTGDAGARGPAGAGAGDAGAATASTATGTRARDAGPDDAHGPAGAGAHAEGTGGGDAGGAAGIYSGDTAVADDELRLLWGPGTAPAEIDDAAPEPAPGATANDNLGAGALAHADLRDQRAVAHEPASDTDVDTAGNGDDARREGKRERNEREFRLLHHRLGVAAWTVGSHWFGPGPTRDDRLAEVVDETLTRAVASWDKVRKHGNPIAWATVAALDVCGDLTKRERRRGGLTPAVLDRGDDVTERATREDRADGGDVDDRSPASREGDGGDVSDGRARSVRARGVFVRGEGDQVDTAARGPNGQAAERSAVAVGLDALSRRERVVLVLRHWARLRDDEISLFLGKSLDHVGVAATSGTAKLRHAGVVTADLD